MKLIDLFERTIKPKFLSSITADLKSLEKQLWEKEFSVPEIIQVLNKKLEMYLIRFEETFSNGESEYSRVGLFGGNFSPTGWITIGITHDADEVFNGETNVYFSEFVDLCSALIGHELTHREQVLKSIKNFDNIPDVEDRVKYLSDHREIEAFAVQAALELLPQLDKSDILSKLSNLEKLATWSNAIKMYVHTFDERNPALKKFMKKLYEILHENDEDSRLIEGKKDPQLGDVYDPDYFYHTTNAENLKSIKENGLTGGHKATFDGYNSKKVHLSPTLDSTEYWNGMVNHAVTGEVHHKGDKTILLRVLKSKVTTSSSYRKDEVFADSVKPEDLMMLKNGKWIDI